MENWYPLGENPKEEIQERLACIRLIDLSIYN